MRPQAGRVIAMDALPVACNGVAIDGNERVK
jgi:hypothetical protein